jgi:hypothetical protein
MNTITVPRAVLKQALEALEFHSCGDEIDEQIITALRAALAQQEQEPGAWGWRYDSCGHAVVNRLAVTETPEPTVFLTNVFARGPFPLYTTPPRREWRSLTEEEREQATGWSVEHIEAKLKERNNG